MNIRKETDYSAMYTALDNLMAQELPQMELYSGIGRIVSGRAEKGAAVTAAQYLQAKYPDVSGFSPRNLRRMREFYRAYGSSPALLGEAMAIGWTQNAVILESGLTLEEMGWYIRAVHRCGWTKKHLMDAISAEEHLSSLDCPLSSCYTEEENEIMGNEVHDQNTVYLPRQHLPQPNGGVYYERPGEESRTGKRISHQIRRCRREELGNPVYPPARRKLAEHGLSCTGKTARQLQNHDYEKFDLLIGMDCRNLRDMQTICGGDFADKMRLLLDYINHPGDVADPWYTGDFETTWRDVEAGCRGLLERINRREA